MVKILVIADNLDVNKSSGAKGRVALIKNLNKAGFDLKILHNSEKIIEIDDINCQTIRQNKINLFYLLSRTQRVFKRLTNININPWVEKYFGFSFTFKNDVQSITKAIKNENYGQYHWILTLSIAASFRSHAALLKLPEWHSKWLAYVHDPYPMHSYPRPYDWVEPGHQFKRNFFLKIAKGAKYMVYPSQYLAEWMESYYHIAKGKAVIVPHQISELTTDKYDETIFGSNNQFRILHAGNLMSARNPIDLIKAFQYFIKKNPEAQSNSKLFFVGKVGVYEQEFNQAMLETPQLYSTNSYLPFSQVNALQNDVSVNVILEAKGAFSPFLPGKFTHSVAADKPILLLGPYYSESRRLLGSDYPFWSEIDNVEQISTCIEKLYILWKENDKKVTLNRPDLYQYLSESYLKTQIDSLI